MKKKDKKQNENVNPYDTIQVAKVRKKLKRKKICRSNDPYSTN